MILKLKQGVCLTQNQAREVADTIMLEPDIGWEQQSKQLGDMKTNVYEVELNGNFGTYLYRVNLSFKLITLLSVKN